MGYVNSKELKLQEQARKLGLEHSDFKEAIAAVKKSQIECKHERADNRKMYVEVAIPDKDILPGDLLTYCRRCSKLISIGGKTYESFKEREVPSPIRSEEHTSE